VDAKATLQGLLRETGDVASVGRAFKAMQKYDLPARVAFWLMFKRDDRSAWINDVFETSGGEAQQVYFAPPEVSCNREQMRVAKQRLEGSGQVLILAGQKKRAGVFQPARKKLGGFRKMTTALVRFCG
jgi:hypothetical protein